MKDMTRGGIVKNIIFFSIPMLLGNVFQQLYNIIDSIVVGRFIGKGALGAVGASFPVMFLIIALIIGATMGSMVLVAQFFGAKDHVNLIKIVDTTYIFLLAMSIVAAVSGLIFSKSILRLLGTPESIMPDAKTYMEIIFIGMPLMFGYNALSAVMRGVGDSKTPLYLLIVASLVNIVLDLLFVIKFKWGVAGAAYATVISQGISFIGGVIYLHLKKSMVAVRMRTMQFDLKLFIRSIKIGVPSGVQQMAVAFGLMALTRIVNGFGADALAAFTVAGRIDSFAMMPAMNFSIALSTFTGQNIGAKQMDRVYEGVRSTLLISSIVCVFITLVIIIFKHALILLFNNDPEVVRIGTEYLLTVSTFYIFFSVMFIFNGALRGGGVVVLPMIITIAALWGIRIPLSFVMSRFMGTAGIWWGIPIAWVIGAACSSIYYKFGNWERKIEWHQPESSEQFFEG